MPQICGTIGKNKPISHLFDLFEKTNQLLMQLQSTNKGLDGIVFLIIMKFYLSRLKI